MRSLIPVALVLFGIAGIAAAGTAQFRMLIGTGTIDDWTYWIWYGGFVAVVVGVGAGTPIPRPARPRKPRRSP